MRLNYFLTLLICFVLFCKATSIAQNKNNSDVVAFPEKSEAKISKVILGINGGIATLYGDVKPHKNAMVFGADIGYYTTTYLLFNLNAQKGKLNAGDQDMTTALMGAKGDYFSAALSFRFMPIALLNFYGGNMPKFMEEIYGGAGFGYLNFNVLSNDIISDEFGSLGKFNGSSTFIPIEVGWNIPVAQFNLKSKMMLTLNYKSNLCFTDNIDGYVPKVTANRKNDAFNTFTAGLAFSF